MAWYWIVVIVYIGIAIIQSFIFYITVERDYMFISILIVFLVLQPMMMFLYGRVSANLMNARDCMED